MTKKEWMDLFGTPNAPSPDETGWTGFSHLTRKQWAKLYLVSKYNKGKKMNEANFDINGAMATAKFNAEAFRTSIEAAQETERHQGREREVVAPGNVGDATMNEETDAMFGGDGPFETVQTDADINP